MKSLLNVLMELIHMKEIWNVRHVLQARTAFLRIEDLQFVKTVQKTVFLKLLCLFLLMITTRMLIDDISKELDNSR